MPSFHDSCYSEKPNMIGVFKKCCYCERIWFEKATSFVQCLEECCSFCAKKRCKKCNSLLEKETGGEICGYCTSKEFVKNEFLARDASFVEVVIQQGTCEYFRREKEHLHRYFKGFDNNFLSLIQEYDFFEWKTLCENKVWQGISNKYKQYTMITIIEH